MSEDFSRLGARLLAAQIHERKPSGLERDQGIAVVARAIVERARRRQRARVLLFGAGISAAAAVALVAGFLGARQATSVDALSCGDDKTCVALAASATRAGFADGHRFEPGQRIAASGRGPTLVEFGPAAQLALEAHSELEYREGDATRRFGLVSGAVHLHVGKLAPGQRFLVETPDAEVEVRGTAFHVALAEPGQGCAATRTRVAVDEGVVEVRFHGKSYRITPGEHWPARCEELLPVAAAQVSSPVLAPAQASEQPSVIAEPPHEIPHEALRETQRPVVHEARHATETPAKVSSNPTSDTSKREPEAALKPSPDMNSALFEQNNLYAKAVAAQRAGRLSEALSGFEQFLARFPGGALAESAQGARLRLVMRLQPGSAKAEAARYLARYPRGLASAEARALLNEP